MHALTTSEVAFIVQNIAGEQHDVPPGKGREKHYNSNQHLQATACEEKISAVLENQTDWLRA